MATSPCGIGGWGGPLPGDPDNNSVLTATPAFGGIDVAWTYPTTNPAAVAHTLLYRAILPSFDAAVLHRTVTGDFFYDRIETGVTLRYYYWIRIVSVNGTVGELIGPASAVARPLIEDLIEQLTAQIDSGLLAETLRADLDKISLLNTNLLNEIMSRENGEISLSAAIAEAQAGTAQALTFIQTSIASQATTNSAIAEQISLVGATLGDNYAVVTQAMQVDIDSLKGTVDAMYTAKVTVNGLIGGFGIHNNGASVDAGFDVDTFWVGRTAANKRKPFIISGTETFIDEAVINHLTFSKLRDEAGSFIVQDGKVKAQYMQVDYLSALSASVGALTINGSPGGWGYINSPGKWRDDNWGFALAQAPAGDMFVDFNLNGCGLVMHHQPGISAIFHMWGPGFDLSSTSGLTVSQLNVIGTAQIQGQAVTVPDYTESGGFGVVNLSTNTSIPWEGGLVAVHINSGGAKVLLMFDANIYFTPADVGNIDFRVRVYRDGGLVVDRSLPAPTNVGATTSLKFWVDGTSSNSVYQVNLYARNGISQSAQIVNGLSTLFGLGVKR